MSDRHYFANETRPHQSPSYHSPHATQSKVQQGKGIVFAVIHTLPCLFFILIGLPCSIIQLKPMRHVPPYTTVGRCALKKKLILYMSIWMAPYLYLLILVAHFNIQALFMWSTPPPIHTSTSWSYIQWAHVSLHSSHSLHRYTWTNWVL